MTTAPAVCAALVKLVLALALVCVEAQLCSAKNLGLLVGISNYQSPNIRTLQAPPNDLRIMWDALRKRGFAKQDLTVLADAFAAGADAPETMGVPTAANILRALDDLAARVQPGDLVVFYFSGHGTKINQPRARDPSTHVETDGKDEVLLAIDAGTYDYIKRVLPGGIVDDVLKKKFDALRSRAFVWVILDACHSGGMTRAAGQNETIIEHFVDGRLLSAPVDDASPQKKEVDPSLQDFARTDNEWVPKSRGGKLVAFMASNTDQFAIERPIPEQQGKPFSVFTYNLVRALERRVHGTYAQLAESVALARLAGTSTLPTPVFEGDLNQPLFQGQAQRPLLWPARIEMPDGHLNVDAGQLQGVRKGTILALISEAKVVGFAEVTKAGLSQSLAMIDPPGRKKLDQKRIDGPLLARINTSPVSFVLNVARPPESERGSHPGSEPGFAAIEQLSAEGMRVLPIAWKPFAATEADVRLSVLDGVIYILPSTGEIRRKGNRRSRSVKIEPEIAATAKRLRESLWTVLRQKNLLRIASDIPRTALYDAGDVRIRLLRNTDRFRRVIKREEQECGGDTDSADARTSAEFTIAEASKLVLTHCDQIEVKNQVQGGNNNNK